MRAPCRAGRVIVTPHHHRSSASLRRVAGHCSLWPHDRLAPWIELVGRAEPGV